MGLDDRARAQRVLLCAAPDLLPGHLPDHHRPRLQPAGRRPARRARPPTFTVSTEVTDTPALVAPVATETLIEDVATVAAEKHKFGDVLLDVRGLRTSF